MAARAWVAVFTAFLVAQCAAAFSLRILHRFSEEVKSSKISRNLEASSSWPEKNSLEYCRLLMSSDIERQKMKLGPQFQLLFPSEGSKTMAPGNDFAWLHYTWIDVGMPSVSFLVALDTGSDLLWVPCDCIECAPLSSYNLQIETWHSVIGWVYHVSIPRGTPVCSLASGGIAFINMQDKELNEYMPAASTTSKHLFCSHELCEMGPNCKNPKDNCPYTVTYESENTSTSGLLFQDILHLSLPAADMANTSVRAPVIIGCGRKQSGGYLDGSAPDGLLGLGLGDISVPSFLSKAGFVRNSFSLCFSKEGSGRIFFGDVGLTSQQTTPFLPLNGNYITYIVKIEACCVGNSSRLEKTSFQAVIDSGTSFTFLPRLVYNKVVEEFDKRVNAQRAIFEGYPWDYCYESSFKVKIPSVMFKFAVNNSFVVHNPVFQVPGGFCLAVALTQDEIATIGQNFMTGYKMVFDRENLKLGWSKSNCQDTSDGKTMPLIPGPHRGSSGNPLPTTEQERTPDGHAVASAVAGRTLAKSSVTSFKPPHSSLIFLLLLFSLVL